MLVAPLEMMPSLLPPLVVLESFTVYFISLTPLELQAPYHLCLHCPCPALGSVQVVLPMSPLDLLPSSLGYVVDGEDLCISDVRGDFPFCCQLVM